MWAAFKPGQEILPKYIEQGVMQAPSSQFAERAGSGLKVLLQQQGAARAGCTCAGARTGTILSFSVARVFLTPVSLTQRDEAQRIEVQYRVSVSGALSLFVCLFTEKSLRGSPFRKQVAYTSLGLFLSGDEAGVQLLPPASRAPVAF